MAAVAQIVDGIGGTVLVDLNGRDGATGVGTLIGDRTKIDLAGTTLAQVADQPVVWTPLAQPELITTRQITLPLVVLAADPADLQGRVRLIMELTRRPWWLRLIRHGATEPMYLRCWPCLPQFETNITATGYLTAAVGLLTADTDPYAYSQRVDQSAVLVTQDTSVAGACVLDVAGVRGDSLTPASLTTDDQQVLGQDTGTLVAVRRRGSPTNLPSIFTQMESGSQFVQGVNPPNVGPFFSDPTLHGSGGVAINFTAQNNVGGLSIAQLNWQPALTGPEAAGTYRLLIRARRSGGSAGVEHNFRVFCGPQFTDTLFTAGGADTRVLDCGLFQVPTGAPAYNAAPQAQYAAAAAGMAALIWKQAAGAGRVDVDWAALVPADEGQAVIFAETNLVLNPRWLSVDGYDHSPRVWDQYPHAPGAVALGQTQGGGLRVIGGIPMLGPGSNRLWFIGGLTAATGASWDPGKSFRVSVSYWPRWAWLT